ncbi:MAG: hypothetical protein AAGJ85_02335, partial [Pseudomonadota bacterium]
MQWLISQIWILLAVAALLGLILGLALRGLMSAGKMRRATVERDIARTELGQARSEIDALYASQRKMKEEGVVRVDTSELDAVRADLANRDAQISELQNALQVARDDAEAAKADNGGNTLQTAGAAVAGAVGGALLGGDDDKVKELEERNTWLEERVAALEADLETTATTVAEVIAQPDDAESAVLTAATEETGSGVSTAKLEWQNTYLRQRVEALEDRMQVAAVPVPASPETNDAEAEPEASADTAETDEELARLRWRNRYLEGRLAYYEDGEGAAAEEKDRVEDTDDEEEDDDGGLITAAVTSAGAVATAAALMSDEAEAEEIVEEAEEAPAEDDTEAEIEAIEEEGDTETLEDDAAESAENLEREAEVDDHDVVAEEEHVSE